MNDFFHERLNTVVDRITPYLKGERQKDDLRWSVSELNNFYKNKIEDLEIEKEEACQHYFKKHHLISASQSIEMFKYVKNIININKEVNIETDPELQNTVLEVFNDILQNNEHKINEQFQEISKTEEPLIEGYTDPHQPPGYDHNYYQEEHCLGPEEDRIDFRKDINKFLIAVNHKKGIMRKSRENIIDKIRRTVEEVHKIQSIEIYGSFKTNLDLPWSDIDFVAFSQLFDGSQCLNELNTKFEAEKVNKWITKIEYISSASVPIIKLETEDNGYNIKVDITFGDHTHKGSQ